MEFGILGLELSGKTTLFSLLTGHATAATPHKREAHVGVAHVPDARLDTLTAMFKPKKHTPATVKFVDVPGVTKGGSQSLNLPELRQMDGLAVVVRGFASDAVPHPEGTVDPARDLELLETEMLLADLSVVTNRLERIEKDMVKKKTPELQTERDLVVRFKAALEKDEPLRGSRRPRRGGEVRQGLRPPDAEAHARDPQRGGERRGRPRGRDRAREVRQVEGPAARRVQRRLGPDRAGDRRDVARGPGGVPEGPRPSGSRAEPAPAAAYDLLGLMSFLTAGEDECRAWTIPKGTHAAKAAAAIHTDFEKHFIRAEVVPFQTLVEAGSFAHCKTHGTLRVEGRDYVVQDGDVVNFRVSA